MSAIPEVVPQRAESAVSNKAPEKLGTLFKAGYGSGQLVESYSGILLNTFLFYYLTNVRGLSGSLTGLAMFISLAIDAIADPVIGSISDNLVTRWGRRIPFMMLSLLPIAVSLGLMFSIPRFDSSAALFAYTLLLLVTLRVSISGFLIPYLGMGAELSDDYDERSRIVAFRTLFAILSTLLGLVLGFGLFLAGPNGLLEASGYAGLGWTSAAIVLVTGMIATGVTLRALPRLRPAQASSHSLARRLLGEVKEVFANPSFRRLFGGVLVFFVGQGVLTTLGLDGNQFFWGFEVGQIKTLALATVIGLTLGLPLAFLMIGRIEKRTVLVTGICVVCVAQGFPPLLQMWGWLPQGVNIRLDLLMGVSALMGMTATLVAVSGQSAMADAVDEHECLFSTRREGLYFSSLTFASKAALGLGSLISGICLDAIHFPSQQIASGASVSIPPAVVNHLGVLYGPVPALITALSLPLFLRYRLDRAALAAIRHRLNR
jgi:glycoside/pentoside/hexuronide:cation symporter, GPH family